ncbi:uncharacterized protein LTR77_010210 [Saxophila tyrrhenica]|uniref:Uncharacterized protein n=1 Tax=Saxophila tyrrhenica TaxID=1690608 RepID=A0AAV9NW82_9PEZI|nr:hypothetical protein LTR77_010210 [Saxophila tyrrhenica]
MFLPDTSSHPPILHLKTFRDNMDHPNQAQQPTSSSSSASTKIQNVSSRSLVVKFIPSACGEPEHGGRFVLLGTLTDKQNVRRNYGMEIAAERLAHMAVNRRLMMLIDQNDFRGPHAKDVWEELLTDVELWALPITSALHTITVVRPVLLRAGKMRSDKSDEQKKTFIANVRALETTLKPSTPAAELPASPVTSPVQTTNTDRASPRASPPATAPRARPSGVRKATQSTKNIERARAMEALVRHDPFMQNATLVDADVPSSLEGIKALMETDSKAVVEYIARCRNRATALKGLAHRQ